MHKPYLPPYPPRGWRPVSLWSFFVALLMLTGMWAGGACAAGPGDWGTFHHDVRHTGCSPFAGPTIPAVSWAYSSGGSLGTASPVLAADGTIYIGSADGYLNALYPDGSLKWQFPTGQSIDGAPAIGSDGTIYVGSEDDNLYALNPDGSLKWLYSTGGSIESSPVLTVSNGKSIIYFGSDDCNVYALTDNGTAATCNWHYPTGDEVCSSPAIGAGGTIYVGSFDKNLYALTDNGSSCTVKWQYPTGDIIWSSPAIDAHGTIYLGSYDDNLYSLTDTGNGYTLNWYFAANGSINSTPAVGTDGTIYCGSLDHNLYALDPSNGSLKWQATMGDQNYVSSPALAANGMIYLGAQDGKLYAFTTSGALQWSYNAGSAVNSSPVLGPDGTLYAGSINGYLYAITQGVAPNLMLSTSVTPASAPAGATLSYTLAYSNTGAGTATNVVLSDVLPAGVAYVYGSAGAGAGYDAQSATLTCQLSRLPPGGAGQFTFQATVVAPATVGATLSNQAAISCDQTPNPTNSNVAVCTVTAPLRGDWWMVHHDPRHTGSSPVSGPSIPSSKWSYVTGNIIGASSPAIAADGTIYLGSEDGHLYAIHPADGSLSWDYATGSRIESSPAIGTDGTIYFGCDDYSLYALTPAGALKWHTATSGMITSSPVIGADGTIYVGSNDSCCYAFSPTDGSIRWQSPTGGSITSSPVLRIDNGAVYIGSEDTNLYAFDSTYGTLIWAATTGGGIDSSPAVGTDGTIYVGADDGKLYAINPANGTINWQFPTGGTITSSPALSTGGTIYVGSQDGNVYAVTDNGTSATLDWQQAAGAAIGSSSPAIGADGTVYLGCTDGKLYAFNGATGAVRWHFTTGNSIQSSPVLGADGTLYIGSEDDRLYAITQGALPLLTLTQSVSTPSAPIGGTLLYTLAYANSGAGTATDVTLSDVLPADLALVSGSAGANATYNEATSTLTWTLASLATGGAGQLTFQATVAATATVGEIITNTPTIACDQAPTPLAATPTPFTVKAPLIAVNLTATPAFPQPVATTITLSAAAVGGVAVQYAFWTYNPTATPTWTLLQPLSSTANCQWTPAVAGDYLLDVTAQDGVTGSQVNSSQWYIVTSLPLSAVSLSASPAALQQVNQPVALIAQATGGDAVQYMFWVYNPLAVPEWSQAQAFSSVNTCSWTPSLSGDCMFAVTAQDGITGAIVTTTAWYAVIAGVPLSAVTVSASPAAPQTVNTAITLTAVATGGSNVQYMFWVYNPATIPAWSELQAYSASATCSWAPAAPGHYLLSITACDGVRGTVVNTMTWDGVAGTPITAVSISANPVAPQPLNTPITLTAAATGGAIVEYQFWTYNADNDPTWQLVQAYSVSATCRWTPAAAGNYLLSVTAHDDTTGQEMNATAWYGITGAPLTAVSLATAPNSPLLTSAPVFLNATAAGGTDVQYQFWVYNAMLSPAWSAVQAFSLQSTCFWSPTVSGNYLLAITARDGVTGQEVNTSTWYVVNLTPITSVSLTVTPAAPQPANTPVTLTAAATGGSGVQYMFWVYNAVAVPTWSQVQTYSTTATCLWTPPTDGDYLLSVTARDSITGQEVNTTAWYLINN